MRPRDIVRRLKNKTLKYIVEFTGPSRKKRREEIAKSRRDRLGRGPKRMKPKNWHRDKHKRRKAQKERRKQLWKRDR